MILIFVEEVDVEIRVKIIPVMNIIRIKIIISKEYNNCTRLR